MSIPRHPHHLEPEPPVRRRPGRASKQKHLCQACGQRPTLARVGAQVTRLRGGTLCLRCARSLEDRIQAGTLTALSSQPTGPTTESTPPPCEDPSRQVR